MLGLLPRTTAELVCASLLWCVPLLEEASEVPLEVAFATALAREDVPNRLRIMAAVLRRCMILDTACLAVLFLFFLLAVVVGFAPPPAFLGVACDMVGTRHVVVLTLMALAVLLVADALESPPPELL